MENRGISKLDLKRRNRMQILRVIRESGPISRVDVASALEITRAAVTIITNEMIEEGVLVEIGEAPVNTEKLQKGRRKILIDINENSRFALGATVDEKALARTEAIILSMTPEERENPSILGSSRKKRIAAGSGTQVVDINRLLKQFEMMQQMTKQFSGKAMKRGRLGKMKGFPFG